MIEYKIVAKELDDLRFCKSKSLTAMKTKCTNFYPRNSTIEIYECENLVATKSNGKWR